MYVLFKLVNWSEWKAFSVHLVVMDIQNPGLYLEVLTVEHSAYHWFQSLKKRSENLIEQRNYVKEKVFITTNTFLSLLYFSQGFKFQRYNNPQN